MWTGHAKGPLRSRSLTAILYNYIHITQLPSTRHMYALADLFLQQDVHAGSKQHLSLPIQTNNDLEGYHNGLNINSRAGGCQNLPFYMLVELFHREVGSSPIRSSPIQICLISQKKLKRHQQTTYWRLKGKIMGAWEDYSDPKLIVRQLPQTCSHINGLARMESGFEINSFQQTPPGDPIFFSVTSWRTVIAKTCL